MFYTVHKTNFKSSVTFTLSSANAFNLDKPEILSFGNELNSIYIIHPVEWSLRRVKKLLCSCRF